MSEDFATEEKQRYLREKILDKGYPADKFVEYMASHRGTSYQTITSLVGE